MTEPSHPFRSAVKARDLEALAATLTSDVTFYAPIRFTPFVSRDAAAATMSGLEYLRAFLTGELPPAPISALMGLSGVEVEEGRVLFRGEPGEQHLNPIGTVHGGFAATLLDSALGCAVHTTLPPGWRSPPSTSR